MRLITNRIRGMQDLLPGNSENWRIVEKTMCEEASLHGFKFIRTPAVEHTELFERSVGDTSDIATKEMYTFDDKGGRSVTLRPEGTAGALRAVLENGLHNSALPLKLMYTSSCYRYEKPQSGRYREFFQFGLEVFGSDFPLADAELIIAAESIIDRLGIKDISLEINSIGCSECRKKYNEAIKNHFASCESELCETCCGRLKRNSMRIFDCKNESCKKICETSPVILDFLCDDCQKHFNSLQAYLSGENIEFTVNPKIVRGLDYYCRTVFEFVWNNGNAPIAVCGGGRYDGLSEILGGPHLPALGFGMGMERILMIMESQNITFGESTCPQIFVATADENARPTAIKLVSALRKSSVYAETDIMGKNLKPQMKYADKIKARYVMVLGDDEIKSGIAKIKEMSTGKEMEVSLDEKNFISDFLSVQFDGFAIK